MVSNLKSKKITLVIQTINPANSYEWSCPARDKCLVTYPQPAKLMGYPIIKCVTSSFDDATIWHMKKDASEPDSVFKIAKQCVDNFLSSIGDDSSTNETLSDDEVHNLRVCTKKLRALLQVYRPCHGKKEVKSVEGIIKALAKSYSEQRDAHVQYETLTEAVSTFSQDHHVDMQSLLSHFENKKHNTKSQGVPIPAHAGFDQILQAWKAMLKPDAAPDIKAGVDFAYLKARKLAGKTQSHDDDEAYHECRKWVKYYRYQLNLLAHHKSDKDEAYVAKLTTLGEKLGVLNDRCVLEHSLGDLLESRQANSTKGDSNLKNAGKQMQSWLTEQKLLYKAQCNELFDELFAHAHNPVKL
jgi:CHAD domain-containing protein